MLTRQSPGFDHQICRLKLVNKFSFGMSFVSNGTYITSTVSKFFVYDPRLGPTEVISFSESIFVSVD